MHSTSNNRSLSTQETPIEQERNRYCFTRPIAAPSYDLSCEAKQEKLFVQIVTEMALPEKLPSILADRIIALDFTALIPIFSGVFNRMRLRLARHSNV